MMIDYHKVTENMWNYLMADAASRENAQRGNRKNAGCFCQDQLR
jgi:hypothetical protein